MDNIIFATGIECSYPTVQHGVRRDELASCGHYEHWREDFEICKRLGVRYLRYGPPYYRMHLDEHRYDWSFTDEVLPVLRDLGITPILDLCHFGLPDWAGDFQNQEWPELFADYAEAFAVRYPWIKYYTPANEILVCARFSGKLGIWNEQKTSDEAMIMAHANLCRATLLAIERILRQRPDAIFVQSEVAEQYYPCSPEVHEEATFKNKLRFLTFDFLYGHPPDADVLMFLEKHGLHHEMYHWFMRTGQSVAPHCVMGMDYYAMNEQLIGSSGDKGHGPVLGWASIAETYYQRYHRPMMLTETNTRDADKASQWLWRVWHNVEHLRQKGVPVLGFTWYSLTDQVDWDIQLREIRGKENSNGLYTLARTPRTVASEFSQLIQMYHSLPLLEDAQFAKVSAG